MPSRFPAGSSSRANPESVDASADGDDDRPLALPGVGLLALLLARYAPGDPIPQTYREAYKAIHKHGEGLFGTFACSSPGHRRNRLLLLAGVVKR